MGKRSTFERREGDFYATPKAAVVPLVPHLRRIRSFAEPCAGDGALVQHLEAFGLRCVYAGDTSAAARTRSRSSITAPPCAQFANRNGRPDVTRVTYNFSISGT